MGSHAFALAIFVRKHSLPQTYAKLPTIQKVNMDKTIKTQGF